MTRVTRTMTRATRTMTSATRTYKLKRNLQALRTRTKTDVAFNSSLFNLTIESNIIKRKK